MSVLSRWSRPLGSQPGPAENYTKKAFASRPRDHFDAWFVELEMCHWRPVLTCQGVNEMSEGDAFFSRPTPPKPAPAVPAQLAASVKRKKTAPVLDMGEASREQGFKLNGCR